MRVQTVFAAHGCNLLNGCNAQFAQKPDDDLLRAADRARLVLERHYREMPLDLDDLKNDGPRIRLVGHYEIEHRRKLWDRFVPRTISHCAIDEFKQQVED